MKKNRKFATWLATTRKRVPLTQAELSEYLDVSQPTISYWEDEGLLAMEPDQVRKLAGVLRVDPVEVAEALGYPTRPAAVASLPMPLPEWVRSVGELSLRLGRVVEDWAIETYPQEDEGPSRNRHSG